MEEPKGVVQRMPLGFTVPVVELRGLVGGFATRVTKGEEPLAEIEAVKGAVFVFIRKRNEDLVFAACGRESNKLDFAIVWRSNNL